MTQQNRTIGKQLLTDFVVILILGLLAFGIHAIGDHLADQTRALRTEGAPIEVEVIAVMKGKPRKVAVNYGEGAADRTVELFAWDPPPQVGARLTALYHPDRPDRLRIRPLDEVTIYEDRQPFRMLPLFFLAPLVILIGARAARLCGRDPMSVVGVLVGAAILALIGGVNFFDDVQLEITKRLGTSVLGMPSHVAVSLAQLLVLGPILVAWGRAALQLFSLATAAGAPVRGFGFLRWTWTSDVAKSRPLARTTFFTTSAALLLALIASVVVLSLTS